MFEYKATITRVVDGDTLHADLDLGFKITINTILRLYNVDTPETYRPKSEEERALGLKAKEFVSNFVSGQKVTVKTIRDKKGKYGRYLAEIYVDGEDKSLNELLVENKLTKADVVLKDDAE